jgi:hypothetical protein
MRIANSFALTLGVLTLVVAWVGVQVAFPLVPALGRIARRLPDSVQMLCIITLLTVSVVGTIYFFYEWASARIRDRSAPTLTRFCIDDPRLTEGTVNNKLL